jgi:hypothetical protein
MTSPNYSPGVEAVKWVAFALMVLDHVTLFITPERPAWAYLLGRLVFPLFAMSLAFGLRNAGELAMETAAKRLLMWALVAQVPYSFVIHEVSLNVLFTFWAAVFLYASVRWHRFNVARGALVLAAVLVASIVEFGPVGIMFVVCCVGHYRSAKATPRDEQEPGQPDRSRLWWLAGFWVTLTLLHAINGVPVAMLAPLVFWALVRWGEVPRYRHAFYVLYPAQFAAIAIWKAVL